MNRRGGAELSQYKDFVYVLKAFAIFGVVCAHGTSVPEHFSTVNHFLSLFIQEIGAVGVGIFFCVSGFLFCTGSSREETFLDFLKKKFVRIGIPWIVSATLVYLYVAIRKGGSIGGYFQSMGGYMSSYWYLSVLMVLYLVFYFAFRCGYEKTLSLMFVAAAMVSVLLRNMGVIPQSAFGVYLNPLNWGIFFSIGILASSQFERLLDAAGKCRYLLWIAGGLIIFLLAISGYGFSYYIWYYIPLEIILVFCAVSMADYLRNNKVLEYIGRESFAVYLYGELPWAGLIAYIANKYDFWLFVIIRPVLVIVFTLGTLHIGYVIFRKIGKEKLFSRLTAYL